MKMLQVEDETHEKIKIQALLCDMSIKEYMKYLADKDIKCKNQ